MVVIGKFFRVSYNRLAATLAILVLLALTLHWAADLSSAFTWSDTGISQTSGFPVQTTQQTWHGLHTLVYSVDSKHCSMNPHEIVRISKQPLIFKSIALTPPFHPPILHF